MSVAVLVTCELELSPSLESEWLNDLPPARRAQIGRWPERRDRQRSLLASRLLLAHLRRLGHPPSALATLRYPPRSRPTLDLPLHWSLAHCDGRIVAAASTGSPVGVDVEELGRLQAGDFALYLNAAERAWAGRSARRFYSLWTRKEALAKATGEGIGGVFRHAREASAELQDRWTLSEVNDLPGYAACVAAEGAGWELVRCTMADGIR